MKITLSMMIVAVISSFATVQADEVKVQVTAPANVQSEGRKPNSYERYKLQYKMMQDELDEMLQFLEGDEEEKKETSEVKIGTGQLSTLHEKAARADALAREIEITRVDHARVLRECNALHEEVIALRAERDAAAQRYKGFQDDAAKWKEKALGLRETIERLLLGEFEYYEVKAGDTLQGIAANPMVYGDPSRAAWLRQVNERRIKSVESLSPGEMLIVPRFPRNGSYEF